MPRLTLIARVADGLPLAASMEDEKEHRVSVCGAVPLPPRTVIQ